MIFLCKVASMVLEGELHDKNDFLGGLFSIAR